MAGRHPYSELRKKLTDRGLGKIMKTFIISGSQEALQALRNMAGADFDACYKVLEESPNLVKLEDITDPNNMVAAAAEGIVNDLPQVFAVTVTSQS